MFIYNSKTNSKELFKSIKKNEVTLYFCGPTIYSDIHIGNARPMITFDILTRYFEILGNKVISVSNITDIDDKIINRAQELQITEAELVNKNLESFNEVVRKMNLRKLSHQPRVTEYLPEIIEYIENLIELGYAYEANGSVYFEINKVENYGELSNHNLTEKLLIYERDDEFTSDKKNQNDFSLWKKTTIGQNWASPWGEGRPGWHTECVVMIDELFSGTIDIHGGGNDLLFPHHENENAQRHAHDSELANYWVHNGFINIGENKMSKSMGNTILVKDFLNDYSVNFLKILFLQTSYRQPLVITDEVLDFVGKIEEKYNKISMDLKLAEHLDRVVRLDSPEIVVLKNLLDSDLNFTNAFDYCLNKSKKLPLESQINSWIFLIKVIGLTVVDTVLEVEIPAEINLLLEKRILAKKNNNYELADQIRVSIRELGFEVVDTRNGMEVKCQKK